MVSGAGMVLTRGTVVLGSEIVLYVGTVDGDLSKYVALSYRDSDESLQFVEARKGHFQLGTKRRMQSVVACEYSLPSGRSSANRTVVLSLSDGAIRMHDGNTLVPKSTSYHKDVTLIRGRRTAGGSITDMFVLFDQSHIVCCRCNSD